MQPVIIIGSGMAGYSVAREFRKLDSEAPVLLISADDGVAYSKPMLSNAFAKKKNATTLITASSENMAQQLNIKSVTRTQVHSIDTVAQQISLDGDKLTYQRLVFAVGAKPFRPTLLGDAADHVLAINNIRDYAKFRKAIDGKKRVTIIGGGLIACEFANDLAHAGYQVSVVDRNAWPLGHLLPELIGKKLQQKLSALNVQWLANSSVASVDAAEKDAYRLRLENGTDIISDVVLSATGLKANTTLAAASGLQINRGIVVDKMFQTSVPNVYAIGDCAEVAGLVLPFIMPITRGARALAQTLTGNPSEVTYPVMPVLLKTPAYPISVVAPPSTEGDWKIEETAEGIWALFYDKSQKLVGFALGGVASKESSKLSRDMPKVL